MPPLMQSDFQSTLVAAQLLVYRVLHIPLATSLILYSGSVYDNNSLFLSCMGYFQVKSFYLEDVLSLVRSTKNNIVRSSNENETVKEPPSTEECRVALDEAIDLALSNDELDPLFELISTQVDSRIFNYQHSRTGLTPLMIFSGQGSVSYIYMLLSFGVNCGLRCYCGKTAVDYAEQGNHREAVEILKRHSMKEFTDSEDEQKLLVKYLSNADPELIDCLLIEQLLRRICSDSKDGAVLVFLPG